MEDATHKFVAVRGDPRRIKRVDSGRLVYDKYLFVTVGEIRGYWNAFLCYDAGSR